MKIKSIFIECYTLEDKEKLIESGFTFLPEQSNSDIFMFFNNGKMEFSYTDMNIKFHNIAYV